ncbi:MAG: RNA polymerase sigma factor [Actinobacteria bacterium]|nr:RNA polymerase sigma factor [Actinomycetota bacterium]
MTDEQLLVLLGFDPQAGITEVVDRYGGQLLARLRTYAVRRGRGVDDVEDIYQDALIRLLVPEHRADCLSRGGSILPWITWWAKHRLQDVWRAQNRAGLGDLPEPEMLAAACEEDPPSEVNEDEQDLEVLGQALAKLSPRAREILMLKYGQSYTYAELASYFSTSVGAVKKAAHDARSRLQELLANEGVTETWKG